MKSMTFFEHEKKPPEEENNLVRFLENFPENEFWRFFIERKRYDIRSDLYYEIYSVLSGDSFEEAEKIDLIDIEEMFNKKNITIGYLHDHAVKTVDSNLLEVLSLLAPKDNLNEKLTDMFNKHQAWMAFEIGEPGYLEHNTKGLQSILLSIVNNDDFNVEFIKNLHKTCTLGVKNMLQQVPGEFRSKEISWGMTSQTDSLAGLIETIDYLKSVEKQFGSSHVNIVLKKEKSKIITYCDKDTHGLANSLWGKVKKDNDINYVCDEGNIDPKEFLEKICAIHIDELKEQLKSATTKEEKLTAIFTYLKHDVLHHPFKDGTGRTYSMLLSQYLLLRENLLPIIIDDSNVIPGYSVKELVAEYIRGEKEMEEILKNHAHVSSPRFAIPNIYTHTLLEQITDTDKKTFNTSLEIYKEAKNSCLAKLVEEKASPKIS